MEQTMDGGCQCGRVRYRATIRSDEAYLCHCRMCQRATGGVSVAFHNLDKADVVWTTAAPDLYASSPIAERGYCRDCGTPLTFWYGDSGKMDLLVGSFDDAGYFRPTRHFGVESMHPQWLDTRGLPQYRADQNETLTDRWMKTVGRLPD